MTRWRPALRGAAGVLLAAACAGPGGGPPAPPVPDLEALDAPVQAQYRERRAALDAAASRAPAERAEAFGALGQWYHAYLFYDGAGVAYEGARSLAPEDPRWPYYLAHVARATGDRDASSAWLRRVLELDPGHLPARVWLAETEWEGGRTAAAAELFDAALLRAPRCVRALAGRAKVALAEGQPAVAVELYRAALRLQPGAAALRYPLAMAYRQLGDRARAAAELARVPDRNPEHVPLALDDPAMTAVEALRLGVNPAQALGHRALAAGRFDEAAEHFRDAIEADPGTIEARLNLALALEQAGKLEAAEAAAAGAVKHSPGFARARVILAGMLLKQQRFDEARSELEAAVAADPDHELARFNLARMLRRDGRLEDALEHFARVRELDPRLVPASHDHAVTLLRLGRAAEALAALEEDLRRLPGEGDLTLLLARLLAAAPEPALRDGERALELARSAGGRTLSGAETLAMALAESGRFADAVAWQRAALEAARGAGRADLSTTARARLELYLRNRPCREPWAPDESPSSLAVAATPGEASETPAD